MGTYRKRPIVFEAIQWTGGTDQTEYPKWIIDAIEDATVTFDHGLMHIHTLEGIMEVSVNDYVIKGVKNELYPCKPDIFCISNEEVKFKDFQQRVVDEKTELDGKIRKLSAFIEHSDIYQKLPKDEQDRLWKQEDAMITYSGILSERIAAFQEAK